MLSFGTKINIILFLISVLVALYLFIMQKEIRMMQQDIMDLKDAYMKGVPTAAAGSGDAAPSADGKCVMEPLVVFDDEDEEEEDVVVVEQVVEVDAAAGEEQQQAPAEDPDVSAILKTMSEDDHVVKVATSAHKTKKTRSKKE